MAMDPKKLAAFAGAKNAGGGGGGPPPTDEDYDDTGLDEQVGEEEGSEDDMREFGPGRFGDLIPMLEEFADEVEACCDDLSPEYLDNTGEELPPDEEELLKAGLADLDSNLVKAMKTAFGGGITPEEAQELADHLAEEDLIENADRVSGWLFRAASVA